MATVSESLLTKDSCQSSLIMVEYKRKVNVIKCYFLKVLLNIPFFSYFTEN